jgi:hypothetical protein
VDHKKCPKDPACSQQWAFCPHNVNLTNITFTKEEQELLDLRMQYNIQPSLKTYWTNLILKTEQAIRLRDTRIQDAFRFMAAKKLKHIHNTNQKSNHTHKRQRYITKNIQQKTTKNNTIITQADKGKTTVIIQYTNKITKTKYMPSSLIITSTPSRATPPKRTRPTSRKPYNNATLSSIRNKSGSWHKKPPPTYSKSPTQTPQTRHPHRAGSQQQKCPLIQNDQETRHLKTTLTPK